MSMILRQAHKSDLPALKALWLECFDEDKTALELFFKQSLGAFVACDGEKIAAALYLISASLNGKKAHYLCGAGTSPEYRKRGIMGKLIEYSLKRARISGDEYSLLFPASKSLYDFYSRLGYKPLQGAKTAELTRAELEAMSGTFCGDAADFEELQTLCFKENFLLQNNSFLEFAEEYYKIYGVTVLKANNCVAIAEVKDGAAQVVYCAYSDFSALKKLLLSLNCESFTVTVKSDDKRFAGEQTEHGMIKSLCENKTAPENVYIGITLN